MNIQRTKVIIQNDIGNIDMLESNYLLGPQPYMSNFVMGGY